MNPIRWWLRQVIQWGLWWWKWRPLEPKPKPNRMKRCDRGHLAERIENGKRVPGCGGGDSCQFNS